MENDTNTKLAIAKDEDLIKNVKDNNCSESFSEICKRHEKLFYKTCHSYIKILNSLGFDKTDIFEERDIVILEAINKYNPDKKCSFSSWVGNYTRYFCLNKINKKEIKTQEVAEEEFADKFDKISMSRFEEVENKVDFDSVFHLLDSSGDNRLSKIFALRYDDSCMKKPSWEKIAAQLNLSVQMTVDLHKKAIKTIRREVKYHNADIFSKTI